MLKSSHCVSKKSTAKKTRPRNNGWGHGATAVRRSSRLSEKDDTVAHDKSPTEVVSRRQKRKRTYPDITPTIMENIAASINASPAPARSIPKANSVRSISLDVRQLVHGNADTAGFLGIPVAHTGKEHVIEESFKLASCEEDRQRLSGQRLSFNKYSGVQEWGNDVFFLWVNLGMKNDNVVINDFPEGGKYVTWFGGSRMHDESPVIKDLIRVGYEQRKQQQRVPPATSVGESSSALPSSAGGIVLWCRLYNDGTKKFCPYICLGRLSYESHVPGSSPLSFVWKLMDFDALQNHDDQLVRRQFEQVISC